MQRPDRPVPDDGISLQRFGVSDALLLGQLIDLDRDDVIATASVRQLHRGGIDDGQDSRRQRVFFRQMPDIHEVFRDRSAQRERGESAPAELI
ncbi:hypothetical protein [Pseudomonas sp. F01002]|uniref:hypothetical protein n=1 Tax=Pseudomonas sp. F01002 TaxID=2555724 RepID=UPI003531B236